MESEINPGDIRTVDRFAWRPVRMSGEPWYKPRSWCHLRWYRAQQRYDETYADPWGMAFSWRTIATFRDGTR